MHSYGFLSIFCLILERILSIQKLKMAHRSILSPRTKRSETCEKLIDSLDTDNDANDLTFENLTSLDFDRS